MNRCYFRGYLAIHVVPVNNLWKENRYLHSRIRCFCLLAQSYSNLLRWLAMSSALFSPNLLVMLGMIPPLHFARIIECHFHFYFTKGLHAFFYFAYDTLHCFSLFDSLLVVGYSFHWSVMQRSAYATAQRRIQSVSSLARTDSQHCGKPSKAHVWACELSIWIALRRLASVIISYRPP